MFKTITYTQLTKMYASYYRIIDSLMCVLAKEVNDASIEFCRDCTEMVEDATIHLGNITWEINRRSQLN